MSQRRPQFTAYTAALGLTVTVVIYLSDIASYSCALVVPEDRDTIILRPPHSGSDRHTMFLPLFLSSPNRPSNHSSASGSVKLLRHVKTSDALRPIARMNLHDDLLLNGYYTTRLWIGTPPKKFALIVDTGSTVTYVPCSTCEQCGKHQDPKFRPEFSSTYQPVKCYVGCTCDYNRNQCIYERQYAEMSSSSGVLGEDVISFGNQSELAPQRAVFGCENVETGDLYSQHADGIMGLGRGDLSIVDHLVGKGVISDSFSLCYGGMGFGGGAMVLGGISSPTDMVFTRSDPVRSPYYNIELKAIQVAGKQLPLDPKVFDGKHGTVLDSGTTYAYLPEEAFQAFKNALMEELHSLKQIRGPDPNYKDICFGGAASDVLQLLKSFPLVDMVFDNGQKLSLTPENYLFRHSKVRGAYCLGFFQNGNEPTTLLGGIIVRNTLVTYDRANENIGFWKTNCSALWEGLNISTAPPPVPSSLDRTNRTVDMPPTLAPSEPPEYVYPGQMEVGCIIFSMVLNVTYIDLKPRITELAEFIAQELDVNILQVHMLNFTSKGNKSLVRWAIIPAGSADYISNVISTGIISRLTEHQMHLSDTFGTYQLFEWNIEPSPERTWWEEHYLAVVIVIIVLILGLSAYGGWFVWKHNRQSLIPYKPVDSAVPEQELQPLQS